MYSSRTVKGRAVLEESAITSNSDAPVRGMLDTQVSNWQLPLWIGSLLRNLRLMSCVYDSPFHLPCLSWAVVLAG